MKANLAEKIKLWSQELGFQQTGISDGRVGKHVEHLKQWLEKNYQGTMHYMENHLDKREAIDKLVPESFRVISVRIDYLPPNAKISETLKNKNKAFVSRYATGRDYHKLIRKRLAKLAKLIEAEIGPIISRAFADSAPVLERAHAENAGLGWIGKNTCVINKKAGSWFFLGELYVNCDLPTDEAATNHCGSCHACIDVCPTQAIVAPYKLDARRCISYLTIEHQGSIPEEFRTAIGNRVYGCDDCQLICPWNKFAKTSNEFASRHQLDQLDLIDAFLWSEEDFKRYTEGSAMKRVSYDMWLRNVAIALGNSKPSQASIDALKKREHHSSELVREHVTWALSNLTYSNKI